MQTLSTHNGTSKSGINIRIEHAENCHNVSNISIMQMQHWDFYNNKVSKSKDWVYYFLWNLKKKHEYQH